MADARPLEPVSEKDFRNYLRDYLYDAHKMDVTSTFGFLKKYIDFYQRLSGHQRQTLETATRNQRLSKYMTIEERTCYRRLNGRKKQAYIDSMAPEFELREIREFEKRFAESMEPHLAELRAEVQRATQWAFETVLR